MQIRTRLTLQFTLIVATILVVVCIAIYFSAEQYRAWHFRSRVEAKALTTANRFLNIQAFDAHLLKLVDSTKMDVVAHQNIVIYSPQDDIAYAANDSIDLGVTPEDLAKARRDGSFLATRGEYELTGLLYKTHKGDYVVVGGGVDKEGLDYMGNLRAMLLLILVVGVAVVAMAGAVFAGRAMRPIQKVIAEVRDISPNNLQARVDTGNQVDEIGSLAMEFNQLLERLERAFNLQRTFVANISHELRNPLTVITSQLEVLLLRDRAEEEYRRSIGSVLDDLRNLNRASASLLELTKLNIDQPNLKRKPIRIDECLWQAMERVQGITTEYNIDMEMDLPEDDAQLLVNGNEGLLVIAFTNLMENGCKFSPDKTMKVNVQQVGDQLKVIFSDNGPGIPKEDKEHMFEPFYRGQNSHKASGYGIGLSLVKRIVDLHQLSITFESNPGDGTRFHITFPPVVLGEGQGA